VSVRLPGKACEVIGTTALRRLLRALREVEGCKVSRLDVAADFEAEGWSPHRVASLLVDGDLSAPDSELAACAVTRVRRSSWDWKRRGAVFYVGSGQGERMLRVYDKGVESGGRLTGLRWELQLRDEWATAFAWRYLEVRRRRLGELWAACLVGFLDVREVPGSRRNVQRRDRLAWFEAFVGAARAATLAPACLSTVAAWLRCSRDRVRGFVRGLLTATGWALDDVFAFLLSESGPPSSRELWRTEHLRAWLGGRDLPALSPGSSSASA
jgi:hypothetical protein